MLSFVEYIQEALKQKTKITNAKDIVLGAGLGVAATIMSVPDTIVNEPPELTRYKIREINHINNRDEHIKRIKSRLKTEPRGKSTPRPEPKIRWWGHA